MKTTEVSPAAGDAGEAGGSEEWKSLGERLTALERENTKLKRKQDRPRGARSRGTLAVVLLLLAALLAPVAVVGTWVRAELVDTTKFVDTLAPLAEHPSVQTFIADEVVDAIDASVDFEGIVHEALAGISSLNMPEQAAAAITLLEGPAVQGIHSVVRTTVDKLVTSPQFADVWEVALKQTHSQFVSVMQGDPQSAIQLSETGTISVELGTIIAEVKALLVGQGVDIANLIPEIDKSIPIVTDDALVQARTGYALAVSAGYWMPWIVLGLLVAGVLVAVNRSRAAAWAGIGLAASFLLTLAGLGTGKVFFIATASPAFMPRSTAEALFTQVTLSMQSILVALTVLAGLIAISAWLFGRSRQAIAIRGAMNRGFDRARAGLDRMHLSTGAFGVVLDKIRPAVWVVAVAATVLFVFTNRPISLPSVVWSLVVLVVVLVLVELLRRPEQVAASPEVEAVSGDMQQTA